jgi:serine/threonine protein kinase
MIESSSDSQSESSSLRQTHQPAQLEETACALPGESPLFQSATDCSARDLSILTPTQAGELGQIGPYRILSVLGSGGMGIVFQAEDTLLQRPVALKVMKAELAAREENRLRFLREARAAAAIDHEHVVTIYQVGDHDGVPYLAMKLLRGESLEDRLNHLGGPLPLAEVLRIGREVAEGLAAAHERGLIHRDIKPANIWLEAGRDWVRIVDFGLARAADEDGTLTQTGILIGTPAYMAPEQAEGEPLDHRCDLFSLGCVLYRMSTGRLPFQGKNSLSMLRALVSQTPPAPVTVIPTLAPPLSELVMSLLEKQPGKRPASARHVVQALQRIAEHIAHPARHVPPAGAQAPPPARPSASAARKAPRPLTPPPDHRQVEEAVETDAQEEVSPKASAGRPGGRRKPGSGRRKARSAGGREDYWERRVIFLAIIVGILIFLLISFLVVRGILKSRGSQTAQAAAALAEAGPSRRVPGDAWPSAPTVAGRVAEA